MSDESARQFVEAVFEKVNQLIVKNIKNTNVERTHIGIVTEVNADGNEAKVDLGFTVTEFLPNATETALVAGSVVKVFYEKSDMCDAYIGVRFKNKEATN